MHISQHAEEERLAQQETSSERYSVTTAITEPFCHMAESAGALLPWGGLRGTKEKEPDRSVRDEGLGGGSPLLPSRRADGAPRGLPFRTPQRGQAQRAPTLLLQRGKRPRGSGNPPELRNKGFTTTAAISADVQPAPPPQEHPVCFHPATCLQRARSAEQGDGNDLTALPPCLFRRSLTEGSIA